MLEREQIKYYNQDMLAKAAVSALGSEIGGFDKLFTMRDHLLMTHNDNTSVRNGINFFFYNLHSPQEGRQRQAEFLREIDHCVKHAGATGARKIKKGSVVFAHSLNNLIEETLMKAATYKKFHVNMVEHKPFDLGIKMSQKLNKEGIKSKVFYDLQLDKAVSNADLAIIGAESISGRGAFAKHGAGMVAKICQEHHIPLYAVAHSFKFDHKNSNVEDQNFEFVGSDKITAFIVEHGIFRPEFIENETRYFHSWIFSY